MTWIVPLLAATSAAVTVAPSIMTFPPLTLMSTRWPFKVCCGRKLHRLLGLDVTRNDVVGQDGNKCGLVLGLEKILNRTLGQGGEGSVGRRERP